jgi:hypothetical protein
MVKLVVYTKTTQFLYINHMLCFVKEVNIISKSGRNFFPPADVELSPQITNTEPAHLYRTVKNYERNVLSLSLSLSFSTLFIVFLEARDR